MEDFLSLEDDFIRKFFALEPAAFKLLSFCQFASQGRGDVNIESRFTDIESALSLSDGDVVESIDALVNEGLIELTAISEESFTYRVNLPEPALVSALPKLFQPVPATFQEETATAASSSKDVSIIEESGSENHESEDVKVEDSGSKTLPEINPKTAVKAESLNSRDVAPTRSFVKLDPNPLVVSLCRKIIEKIEDPTVRAHESSAFSAMLTRVGPEEIVKHLRKIPPGEPRKFEKVMSVITETKLKEFGV